MISRVLGIISLFFGFPAVVSCGEAASPIITVTPEDVRAEYAAKCSGSLEKQDLIPCEVGAVLRVDLSAEVKYSCGLVLMEHIRGELGGVSSRVFSFPYSEDDLIAWSHVIEADIVSLEQELTPIKIEFLIDDFERFRGHDTWRKNCGEQYVAATMKVRQRAFSTPEGSE